MHPAQESYQSKLQSLLSASEAAEMIVRVDEVRNAPHAHLELDEFVMFCLHIAALLITLPAADCEVRTATATTVSRCGTAYLLMSSKTKRRIIFNYELKTLAQLTAALAAAVSEAQEGHPKCARALTSGSGWFRIHPGALSLARK